LATGWPAGDGGRKRWGSGEFCPDGGPKGRAIPQIGGHVFVWPHPPNGQKNWRHHFGCPFLGANFVPVFGGGGWGVTRDGDFRGRWGAGGGCFFFTTPLGPGGAGAGGGGRVPCGGGRGEAGGGGHRGGGEGLEKKASIFPLKFLAGRGTGLRPKKILNARQRNQIFPPRQRNLGPRCGPMQQLRSHRSGRGGMFFPFFFKGRKFPAGGPTGTGPPPRIVRKS